MGVDHDYFKTSPLKERIIMFTKRLLFLFLFPAVLSGFDGRALAQSVQQQFVVTYVEFKPADANAGAQMLEELAANAKASSGVVNFDVLRQIDRPNFFALFEVWTTTRAFSDFQNSSSTQAILASATECVWRPRSIQRLGEFCSPALLSSGSQHAGDQSNICDHARGDDSDPRVCWSNCHTAARYVRERQPTGFRCADVRRAQPNTDSEPLPARRERFARPAGIRRPREKSAQHTVQFRNSTLAFLGAPYDERLYQFINRGQ